MTTLTEARSMMSTGSWTLKPFLALGLLLGLLLSLLWGGVRILGRSIRKGVEPRGADHARAEATHGAAQGVESAEHQARLMADLKRRLADTRTRDRARHERLVARRHSLRQQPRDHMVTMLDWMDAVLDGRVAPDLSRLPEDLRATLERMSTDPAELRAMQQSLSYVLGLDGRRSAAEVAAATLQAERERSIRARLMAKAGRARD